jgi:2-phosphosulfolactate phosphatase
VSINAKVVLSPGALKAADVLGRTVVVFDVLRATTTMTVALSAGASEIRVFDNIDDARSAAAAYSGKKVLCGEVNCLPPPGFDLGNSPRDWNSPSRAARIGSRLFMSTTNGTRAIAAAAALNPALLLIGALVNAKAVADAASAFGNEVTLLCSGTGGGDSLEDLIGAGAVLNLICPQPDDLAARLALSIFNSTTPDWLSSFLRLGAGGRNLLAAGLEADIDFCARLSVYPDIGRVEQDTDGLACRPLRF